MMKRIVPFIVILCTGQFAAALIAALLDLPPPAVRLPAEVAAKLPESGVEHLVTAVLLNFRGYDTLLEIAVLLLALFGMFAAGAGQDRRQRKRAGDGESADPVVQTLARFAAPLMVLAAALSGPGALLQYPPQYAAALILLIEAALTVSLGLILAGLFLFLSSGHDRNVTSDDETCHARFPHPNPPPKGEGANESLREFHFNDDGEAL